MKSSVVAFKKPVVSMDLNEKYEKLKRHIDQLQKKIFQSSIKDANLIFELEQAQKELQSLNKELKGKTIKNG